MRIVRCNWCGEIFSENDMRGNEVCPFCGREDCLMDADFRDFFDDEQLKKLWAYFGDIPINDDDEIEEDFFGYPAGTNRFNIWIWFDKHYSGGLRKLIEDYGNY